MPQRLIMEPGRLLLSRPGFAARPNMPHREKAFDSDWAYAGQLIASGVAYDPAPPLTRSTRNWKLGALVKNVRKTLSNANFEIHFPECPFIPTVLLTEYEPEHWEMNVNRKGRVLGIANPGLSTKSLSGRAKVKRDRIIIYDRANNGPDWANPRWPTAIHYVVFGFAGPEGQSPS